MKPSIEHPPVAKIYGHRGALAEMPENSLEGFRFAAAQGVDGIETDIVLTRDLIPVLHDDQHLPDGRRIDATLCADLPPTIPTLAEGLRAAPHLEWLLEIKTEVGKGDERPMLGVIATKVLRELVQYDTSKFRIWAFEWEVLRIFRRQAPGVRLTAITGNRSDLGAGREKLWGRSYDGRDPPEAVAESGDHGWAAYHALLDEQVIARAKSHGLEVFACILNDDEQFRRLSPLVDGIITDRPSHFARRRMT